MYRMIGWPLWTRALLAGALFGAIMFGWRVLSGESPTPVGAVIALVGGVPYGIGMAVVIAWQQRRLDPPEGPRLTGDERRRAVEAVRRGEPPADPRLAVAARAVAKVHVSQRGGPVALGILFGSMTLVAVAMALWSRPAWWLYAVLAGAVGALAVRQTSVLRRRAADYLVLAGASPGR